MKIEVYSRVDGRVLISTDAKSLRVALEVSVQAGANLRGANLRGANLRGADLRGANLRGANLGVANLGGANLWGANLGGADLWGANLWGANLRGADLGGANLWGANLGGADLWGANLWGADLRGADLGGGLKLVAALSVGPIDAWPVVIMQTSGGVRLSVGCHFFTPEEAEAHWRNKDNRQGLYLLATEGWKILARMAGWA